MNKLGRCILWKQYCLRGVKGHLALDSLLHSLRRRILSILRDGTKRCCCSPNIHAPMLSFETIAFEKSLTSSQELLKRIGGVSLKYMRHSLSILVGGCQLSLTRLSLAINQCMKLLWLDQIGGIFKHAGCLRKCYVLFCFHCQIKPKPQEKMPCFTQFRSL